MRSDGSVLATVIVVAGLVAGCSSNAQQPPPTTGLTTYKIGNATYTNQQDFLVEVQREEDAFVAQVGPTTQRLGGMLAVVLPSMATIRQIWTKVHLPNGSLDDVLARTGEIHLIGASQAVVKGHLFDSVRTVRADAPDVVDAGDADYVLRYGTTNKWTLFNRGGASRDLVLPPANIARVVWLNGLNIAVLNAAADLGAAVVRQPLPSSPVVGAAAGTAHPAPAATGPLSGTAFSIDAVGHAVTNAHVVPNCKSVKVSLGDGRLTEATVAAKDIQNDLAVLMVPSAPPIHARLNVNPPRQGESVVTYGFPLGGALSAQGNLSTGIISALAGIGNDSRLLQISAPVEQGNSGGPLLDLGGDVVGVVSSKINALKLATVTGDIAQNVNFAIKSSILLDFLQSNGIRPETSPRMKAMPLADIGDRARAFTYMVTCER
jgi:hypothetical protein